MVGLDLSANDYVSKPFSLRELLARVRALCGASGSIGSMKRNWTASWRWPRKYSRVCSRAFCPPRRSWTMPGSAGRRGASAAIIMIFGPSATENWDCCWRIFRQGTASGAAGASVRANAVSAGEGCGEVLARASHLLFETSTPERYATVFYGVWDASARTLTYANAGHCAPMLVRDGACIRLESLTTPVPFCRLCNRASGFAPGTGCSSSATGSPRQRIAKRRNSATADSSKLFDGWVAERRLSCARAL